MGCGSRLQGSQTSSGGLQTQAPQPSSQSQTQPQPNIGASSPVSASQQPSGPTTPLASYVAQLQAGKHKHMLTDIGFKDNGGNQVMVARKHSLFSFEYEVLDQYANLMGYIKQHPVSLHNTFDATGAQREFVGRVKHQLMGSMVFQDNFWLEDAGGQRIVTVAGDAFNNQFTLTSTATGGLLATVKLDFPGGFLRNLTAYALGRYKIDVYSNELTPLMLAAFLVALEHRRENQNEA
jgi:uncharacterized protein YxjI